MSIFKAIAHARELKQRAIMQGFNVVDSFDADGYPVLDLEGACGARIERILVKLMVRPDEAQHVDGLGLPQRAYSPHQCQIIVGALEISSKVAGGGTAPADLATAKGWRAKADSMVAKLGMKVSEYYSINADNDTPIANDFATLFAGATLFVEIPADELNPVLSSQ